LEPVTWRPVGQVARPGGSADIGQRQVTAYVSRDADLAHLHPPAAAAHTGSVLRPIETPDPRNKDDHLAIEFISLRER